MNKLLAAIFGCFLSVSCADAWETRNLLGVTAFGSIPASCTSMGSVSSTAGSVVVQSSLDQPITISTSSDCAGTNESMVVLPGMSFALDTFADSQTTSITIYYKYTSSAPTSGNLAVSYIAQTISPEAPAEAGAWSPGLIYTTGIEPGTASDCNSDSGTCIYVDCDAVSDGDGSFASPYNSFEDAVGYVNASSSYIQGDLAAGDHLKIKGNCSASKHTDYTKEMELRIGRGDQCGSDLTTNTTVIKSYEGEARAVFDGESTMESMIHASVLSADHCNGLIIQNIEIRNHGGTGIRVIDYIEDLQIQSVYINGGVADGDGVSGSMYLQGVSTTTTHNYIINNNHMTNENNSPSGGADNRGCIRVSSNVLTVDGSTTQIYDNIIDDCEVGIAMKQSGAMSHTIYDNLVKNVEKGMLIRHKTVDAYQNVFKDVTEFVRYDGSAMNTGLSVTIRNNTIYNADVMFEDTSDNNAFQFAWTHRDNIYVLTTNQIVWKIDEFSSTGHEPSDWTSSYNMISTIVTGNFMDHETNNWNFATAMTELSDATSTQTDITFVDPDSDNFYLPSGSAALTGGTGGGRVGALGEEP